MRTVAYKATKKKNLRGYHNSSFAILSYINETKNFWNMMLPQFKTNFEIYRIVS